MAVGDDGPGNVENFVLREGDLDHSVLLAAFWELGGVGNMYKKKFTILDDIQGITAGMVE